MQPASDPQSGNPEPILPTESLDASLPAVRVNVAAAMAAVAGYLRNAAPDLRAELFRTKQVELKPDGSVVTEIDKRVEAELQAFLPGLVAGSVVLGEETAPKTAAAAAELFGNEYIWSVDPIDGTTNFSMGVPLFAVSIGLMKKVDGEHRPVAGALLYPGSNELVVMDGAICRHLDLQSGKETKLENVRPLSEALPVVNLEFPSQAGERRVPNVAFRHNGATAIDIGFCALGRSHGTICGANIWDFAAALAIAEQQGVFFHRADSTEKRGFSADDFRFDIPLKEWRLKERYLVCNKANLPLLLGIFGGIAGLAKGAAV